MSHRTLLHLIGAGALTLAGFFWLSWRGPTPVMRGAEALDIAVPFWYMILAFPFFGVLLAESWLERQSAAGRILLAQTVVIFLISAARLALHIPVSGHVLLLSFFLLWSMMRYEQPYLTEFLLALGALALVLYTKVFVWQDAMTAALGVALALVIRWAGQKFLSGEER